MSSQSRFCSSRGGFTLIELLVVVAIIALLVSILLPSLNKAREQAKAAVCGSTLRSFGQASAVYETDYESFVPCDPWECMPFEPRNHLELERNPNNFNERADPAHGWLVMYGMLIKPDIRKVDAQEPWENHPYGFRCQSIANPEDLWEGFFCPSQNRRNTMMEDSPELDPLHDHEGYPVIYKYASGFMVNRHLRSATSFGEYGSGRQGMRWPAKPSPNYVGAQIGPNDDEDNIFGASGRDGVYIEVDGVLDYWHTQAVNMSELATPADIMYMCDSVDYHLSPSTGSPSRNSIPYTGTGWTAGSEQSPGLWYNPYPAGGGSSTGPGTTHRQHVVLGARHLGKANVLYADGHCGNENQTVRDKRGSQVIASTFADYMGTYQMGTQHHLAPFGRSP